jgi:hypothetical protein
MEEVMAGDCDTPFRVVGWGKTVKEAREQADKSAEEACIDTKESCQHVKYIERVEVVAPHGEEKSVKFVGLYKCII